MADYIYLLENRLSHDQRQALQKVCDVARAKGLNIFLAGGAVRDLTTGSRVRDLDVSVEGNAIKLKKEIEKHGGELSGEHEPSQTLFFKFSGSVRLEISSTRTETFPEPGKPVYRPSDLKQDLYRRDFTANAMALSLNEGSYGLLIDPMNGIADIENRHLRLVSNYGFIEDPARLLRAVRLSTRLGWQMDERTQARYQTAKEENYIHALTGYGRGYELQEIALEEDALPAMKALESEGWMKHLFPAWTHSKADVPGLNHLQEELVKLHMQGIFPDASAANFRLLTAKLPPKELSTLKKLFPRQGFVRDVDALDHGAKELAKLMTGKETATPSATWKLLMGYKPEAVLWLAHTSKGAAIQTKLKNFHTVWPEARQKIPYSLMQEMRITTQLPDYKEIISKLFLELMDGKLALVEEQKAFLEPYSPPAPPPPVHIRRPRAVKRLEPRATKKKAEKAAVKLAAAAGAETVPPEKAAAAAKPTAQKKPEPAKPVSAEKTEAPRPASKKPATGPQLVVKPQLAAKKIPSATKAAPAKVAAKAKPAGKKKSAPPAKAANKPVAVKAVAKPKPAAKKPAPKPVAKKAPAKKPVPKSRTKPKPKAKPVLKKITKSAPKRPVAKKKR